MNNVETGIQKATDKQIELAIKRCFDEQGSKNTSFADVARKLREMFDSDMTRQGVYERIKKSLVLTELWYGSNDKEDVPVLITESRKMFRGVKLPEKMIAIGAGGVKAETIEGRTVYGEVPLVIAHKAKRIIVCDNNNTKYILTISRMVQRDERESETD